MNEIERCKPWIEAALEYSGGTHDFADVAECIKIGTMQLWPHKNACAVTEIIRYPKKKVLHVFLAGGDLSGILEMLPAAEEWGRLQGCSDFTLAGRTGWSKVMKKHGFEHLCTTMKKEL